MPWKIWKYSTDESAVSELEDMIFDLMHEVAFELDDPELNEWFETGIEIVDDPYGTESVLVYYELQETDMTDVDGTRKPGYTLTIQFKDGQQDTETFFSDDTERWKEVASFFADRIVFW